MDGVRGERRGRWLRIACWLLLTAVIGGALTIGMTVASLAMAPGTLGVRPGWSRAEARWVRRSIPPIVLTMVGRTPDLEIDAAYWSRRRWFLAEWAMGSLWLVDGRSREPQLHLDGMGVFRVRGGWPFTCVEGAYWRPNEFHDWGPVDIWPPSPFGAVSLWPTGIRWPGLIADMALWGALPIACVKALGAFRRARRRRRGACARCGYPNARRGACPECGATADRAC